MSEMQTTGARMHPVCRGCGEGFSHKRARAGYKVCMTCGEQAAREDRRAWCVAQEYAKGNYQLITASSAPRTLRETNQKATRD